MTLSIKKQIRNINQYGSTPYRQVHAHSTGNNKSTAQNEADYMSRKNLNDGYYTHVVGNGQIIQTAHVNRGAWDVGGGYNFETYAAVELIESHKSKAEFTKDYQLYVELLRQLALEAKIPVTLDDNKLEGIKTHDWCRRNQPNNATDHIDPYHYLAKWGISKAKFASDVKNGFAKKAPQVSQSKPVSPQSSKNSPVKISWIPEKGSYTMDIATNLRSGPSTKHKIIAKLDKGSKIKYDAFAITDGYLWIRQPRANGYGYMATGKAKNGKRTEKAWGRFSL